MANSRIFLAAVFIQISTILAFVHPDNFLISCGASSPTTTLDDHRVFISDGSNLASSFDIRSPLKSISVSDSKFPDAFPEIYRRARVFSSTASYRFRIKNMNAAHIIRLHFRAFNSSSGNLLNARFHVCSGGFVLLSNFSLPGGDPVIKEYIFKVKSDYLTITFTPADRSLMAFVNAIEVFSAPRDLISDLAWSKLDKGFKNWTLLDQALESVYRINIGGGKVTPFNDTLWRTWTADDAKFLQSGVSSSRVRAFSGPIEYIEGGASREVAPDHVYDTSRVTDSNMTWVFPLNSDREYLVRMHFCDIISLALYQLYFDILINDDMVYSNLDLSEATSHTLASPYYIDFVVNLDSRKSLKIEIRSSKHDFPANHLGLLNGLEIFKINNTFGSLDGQITAHEICENQMSGGFHTFLNSVMCGSMVVILIVVALMLVKLLKKETRSPLVWLPLPVVDAEAGKLVSGVSFSAGKSSH